MLKLAVLENIDLGWFLLWLVVGTLATWRLTNILHWEGVAAPIRKLFGGVEDAEGNIKYPPTFFGRLFSCFWCLSVWVALGVAVVILVFPWILIPFSLSAVAIIIERLWDH